MLTKCKNDLSHGSVSMILYANLKTQIHSWSFKGINQYNEMHIKDDVLLKKMLS